jgi:hypothetical protein
LNARYYGFGVASVRGTRAGPLATGSLR